MTMSVNVPQARILALFAGLAVFAVFMLQVHRQTAMPAASSRAGLSEQAARPTGPRKSVYHAARVPESARNYYATMFGVEHLLLRETASGNLIRFSYRVVKPELAIALGDKHASPYLIGQSSNAMLQVPVMDKIGQLRQTGLPVAGRDYWMVFSNKGQLVKAGERVNVVIGNFRAEGLVVEGEAH